MAAGVDCQGFWPGGPLGRRSFACVVIPSERSESRDLAVAVFDVSRILVFRKTHFWRGLARFFDPSYPQNGLGASAKGGMQERW
jgi:hypothetical protein